MRSILFPIIAALFGTGGLLCAQDDVATAIRDSTRAAENLEKIIGQTQAEVAEIRADKELNRLIAPDPAPLDTFSRALEQIHPSQIAPILSSLKTTEATEGDNARRDSLIEAFARQKALELALKDAAAEFSPGEAQLRLVRQVALLLTRQMDNVRQIAELASRSATPASLTGAARRKHAVTALEQAALQQEISLMDRTAARRAADWPGGGPIRTAAAVHQGIVDSALLLAAATATGSTRGGPLGVAVTHQKIVEEKLSRLLDTTLNATSPTQIRQDARKILGEIVAAERVLHRSTLEAQTDNPTLAERQIRIEERTAVLQRLLSRLDPKAAQRAGDAAAKMKRAGAALSGMGAGMGNGNGEGADGAGASQSEAIALLEGLPGGAGEGSEGGGEEEGEGGAGQKMGGKDAEDLRASTSDEPPPSAQAIGQLLKKEREAISTPEEEGSLPEYAPLVEQYLRSLTDPSF